MAELLLQNHTTPVLRFPLDAVATSIGSADENDVCIPAIGVADRVCTVLRIGDSHRIVDKTGQGLQIISHTGAFIDGITDRTLQNGDVFVFGSFSLRYMNTDKSPSSQRTPVVVKQKTGLLRMDGDRLTHSSLYLQLPASLGSQRVEITEQGLRIGASTENDIVADEQFVSSFHATVFARGERAIVLDLDSTNGTFINNVRVVEAEIPFNAKLRLAKTEFSVVAVTSQTDENTFDAPKAVNPSSAKKLATPQQCGALVTVDGNFAKIFQSIVRIAAHDATVCIFGETGTGKELVAQALHQYSGRSNGPLVPLNCAAIPSNLIEAELFGYEKGAFTGADRLHKGAFEEAHQGTLFLDEIGELPLEMQAKLLRALETRAVRRIGGKGLISVDVRVVTATHRNLAEQVKLGKFRADLLHRLYVIPIELPPLRTRPDDIAFLSQYFATQLSPNRQPVEVTEDALQKLRSHPFAGNVRELRNLIQRAVILGDGQTIHADDIHFICIDTPSSDDLDSLVTTGTTTLADTASLTEKSEKSNKNTNAAYPAGMTMEEIERQTYQKALQAHASISEAARALGLPKTSFWRRAIALGVLESKSKNPSGRTR